jgi:hypothetical protein
VCVCVCVLLKDAPSSLNHKWRRVISWLVNKDLQEVEENDVT